MIAPDAFGRDPVDLLLRIAAVLVCYAGFSLLQRRLRGLPLLRSLSLPLNLLALGLLLLSFLSSSLGGMHRYVLNGLLTALTLPWLLPLLAPLIRP